MGDDQSDIVSRGKPRRFDLPSRQPWPMSTMFGRYRLVERVRSGADDECYWARLSGAAGFERIVFMRRFAARRLDEPMMEALKRQARVHALGVSQIFEAGIHEEWGFIVSELVVGASIAALAASRRRVSWLVALAIAFDTCRRLARVYERYPPEEAEVVITPSRIVLGTTGEVALCMGIPTGRRVAWHRTLCDVIHPILALAAEDDGERVLLRELFTDEHPDAVWVASDALVQRHPELDPVLPIVFLSLAGRVPSATAHAALVERVPIEELRALWQLVMDTAARREG